VINTTGDLALITDGERRYGQVLFDLCSELVRTGKRGRPPKTLPKGIQVRLKNKGSRAHKRGRKRPKYQAPCREHPHTSSATENAQIYANHLEAFNASLRRRCAAYRRKTNTYANGMRPRTTAIGKKEQNGTVEAQNGAFKRYLSQRLQARGSREFATVEAFDDWRVESLAKENSRRGVRLAEELAIMKPLPVSRMPE
jgi:hypothetical protein